MKETRIIMDMPVVIHVVDPEIELRHLEKIFDFFHHVDAIFSTYKLDSEITQINKKKLKLDNASEEVRMVLARAEQTKKDTNGFFNVERNGKIDPSGIVKGWAIHEASNLLRGMGFHDYYVEAGGDIEVSGLNPDGQPWRVGIRNPFNRYQNVAVLKLSNKGIATSGTAIRGNHIYNPHTKRQSFSIVSMTVIGPNIYEADRFATAAFAMDTEGIQFIDRQQDLEGYMIDIKGIATWTRGFESYLNNYELH